MGGACSTYVGGRVAYTGLVEKPEGKRPLGRSRRSWGIILKGIIKKWVV
jgi:hypothetical protein